jgi:regulator of RNase E activity RraA
MRDKYNNGKIILDIKCNITKMNEYCESDFFLTLQEELFSAIIGDIMDTLNLVKQFLPPEIKPIDRKTKLVGRAMPVLEQDILKPDEAPFGLMFDALDALKPNEVYLATGASPNYALWGGLMTTRAKKLNAAGAVLIGYHRDTLEILSQNFPCFSMGSYAQDQGVRGKVVDYRCSVTTPNGVKINPGDLVFGDLDGVVIVPKEVENEVIEKARDKIKGEDKVRDAIFIGMSTKDAFKKFGVM